MITFLMIGVKMINQKENLSTTQPLNHSTLTNPKVSVIMNCLNGEKYLKEAIDSVYAQTYKNWEIIFWDNASTDRSAEIAISYDARLKYFKGDATIPLGAARNKALEQTKGKFVAFLDCDDLWMPEKLEKQVYILEHSTYPLCYSGGFRINEAGGIIKKYIPKNKTGSVLPELLRKYDINMQSVMMRRRIDGIDVSFDEDFSFCPDFHLFIKIAALYDIAVINEPLVNYRVSVNSLTSKTIDRWWIEYKQPLDEIFSDNPVLKTTYPKEYAYAYAKVAYYKSRYLIHVNRKMEASRELRQHSHVGIQYFLFYLLSLFPVSIWHLVHRLFKK